MESGEESIDLIKKEQLKQVNDNVNRNSRNYRTLRTSEDAMTTPSNDVTLRNEASLTSNTVSFIHLLKANIGPGIHSIPYAFKNSGLAGGFIAVSILGVMCTHCMEVLVRCSKILCARGDSSCLDYASAMEICIETGPTLLRRFAKLSRYIVQAFLCITQIGICCVYIVYCSKNIEQILDDVFPGYALPHQVYWILLPFLLAPLACIRDLNRLGPMSNLANVFTVVGFVLIFRYLLADLPRVDQRPLFSSWNKLPILFGTAIYSFEGIGVVLPIENSMRTPQAFSGWNGVLRTGMVIVVCLNVAVGFYGYLQYGDDVKGSIPLNLPSGQPLVYVIQACLAAGVILGYGIQMYVPVHIIWPAIQSNLQNESCHRWCEYGFRLSFMMLTYLLAVFVPHLGLFISLIGSIGSSFLALVFPCLIQTLILWPNEFGLFYWLLWKNIGIALIGVLGAIIGTYLSFKDLINYSD